MNSHHEHHPSHGLHRPCPRAGIFFLSVWYSYRQIGADVASATASSQTGRSLLHQSARAGNEKLCKFLLSRDANASARDEVSGRLASQSIVNGVRRGTQRDPQERRCLARDAVTLTVYVMDLHAVSSFSVLCWSATEFQRVPIFHGFAAWPNSASRGRGRVLWALHTLAYRQWGVSSCPDRGAGQPTAAGPLLPACMDFPVAATAGKEEGSHGSAAARFPDQTPTAPVPAGSLTSPQSGVTPIHRAVASLWVTPKEDALLPTLRLLVEKGADPKALDAVRPGRAALFCPQLCDCAEASWRRKRDCTLRERSRTSEVSGASPFFSVPGRKVAVRVLVRSPAWDDLHGG